ncbi:aldo/keto reductase [Staphylococcus auricularis]|uniref:aldo/keto reductase n=1 Tax=Staphylococcus auricularis TaxID=29379 RepID=UPI0024315F77|nr:aldo/keto reductase [Staphylococcus auricularis]
MATETYTLNNGYEMPKVGLGVYKITDEQMPTAVDSAIKAGYRAFDTAYLYKNEVSLGQAIKESDIDRESLFITSKLWNSHQGYESAKEHFYQSLEDLGLDYLDLYLIHWPCEADDLFIESYKALEELYKEGKVKAIGVANFKPHHLDKLMAETEIVPAVNQIEVHPFFNQAETQAYCDEHDIIVTAWMPLMRDGGLLNQDTIVNIAKKYNKTPAQVVLRWYLAHNRVVIPKSKSPEHINQNFDIFDFELTEDEVNDIDALNKDDRQGYDPDDVDMNTLK